MEKQTNEIDLMIAIVNKLNLSTLTNKPDEAVKIYEALIKAIKDNK